MQNKNILEQIKDITAGVLRVEKEKITLQSSFEEDLGADSLDKITLLMALEEEFGKPISDSDAQELKSIEAVLNYVKLNMDKTTCD